MKTAPLFNAIERGDANAVKSESARLPSLDIVNEKGMDPLSLAIDMGHSEIAHRLLDDGASPDGSSDSSFSPLSCAIEQPDIPMIRRLLTLGANPNRAGKKENETAFHLFCRGYRDTELYELFIQSGADINSTNGDGESPLFIVLERTGDGLADTENTCRIAEYLIEQGASPDQRMDADETLGQWFCRVHEHSVDPAIQKLLAGFGGTPRSSARTAASPSDFKTSFLEYCETHCIEIPLGLHRREACRWALVRVDVEPKQLVALTFCTPDDMRYYLRRELTKDASAEFLVLDGLDGTAHDLKNIFHSGI